MKLAVEILKGEPGRPAAVFVPGLGMDVSFWAAPSEARILGGLFPLGKLFGNPSLRTLYRDLAGRGRTVATWGPRRPVGPVAEVVRELKEVAGRVLEIESSGIVLIGHSRGGLAARIALPSLLSEGAPVRALITIASPHGGSTMARWASLLAPFASFADSLIPEGERKALRSAVKRALGFLASEGVRELLPDSPLIRSLENRKPGGVYCLSAGGTNPALFEIRGTSINAMLAKALPEGALPDELTPGKGDFLVTDLSARLPFAEEHLTFHKNHLRIILDEDARREILKRIEKVYEKKERGYPP